MRNNRLTSVAVAVVVLCAVCVRVIAQQNEQQTLGNLRSVGQAILIYAVNYKGVLPADLGLLRQTLGPEGSKILDGNLVYTVQPGMKISKLRRPAEFPLVLRQDPLGTLYILYADGHVQAYEAANLPRQATARATTRAAAEVPLSGPPTMVTGDDKTPPPTTVPDDATKAIVGAWTVNIGEFLATYQFSVDGTFTLRFSPSAHSRWQGQGTGKAGGTWTFADKKLVMTNTFSETRFTIVGEKEEAEVVGLNADVLVLKTTDAKGAAEQCVLRRTVPFEKGKRDNEKIVGTWNGNNITLVLANSGTALLGMLKGEWSQRGNQLVLIVSGGPAPFGYGGIGQAGPRTMENNFVMTIDALDDTTLKLTAPTSPGRPAQALTLLRVK